MNKFLPSNSQLMTVAFTLVALWAIHNVDALSPVADTLNFD